MKGMPTRRREEVGKFKLLAKLSGVQIIKSGYFFRAKAKSKAKSSWAKGLA